MHGITRSCILILWLHTLTLVKSKDCTLQDFLSSRLYDSNFDITGLAATYAGGTQVRVGCNVGFAGFFKLLCVEGKWQSRGANCQPRSCGHPGDAQFAEFHLEKGDDFVFGSEVVYTCQQGYQMVSRTNYRRCMAEGWDGVVPVCEAQQCPVIHVKDNVQVIGDAEEATYGNVVRFSCRSSSLILSGLPEIHCEETGEWSGEAPTCIEVKCTAPVIENGQVLGNINEYKENEILRFQCNDKYKPTENRSPTCTKVGLRAEWSPTPLCEPIKCSLSLTPITGTSYEPKFRSVFSPGDTVTVTCAKKFWIVNKRDTSAEVTCKADGTWSIPSLVCQEVTCADPRDYRVYYWGQSYWQTKKLDDTVSYSCRAGYKRTHGRNHATCTRDGWTPNPLCQEITCDKKEDIPNAVIVSNEKWIYKNNERVQYDCVGDYTGRFILTCEANGWTGTPNCREKTCNLPHDYNLLNNLRESDWRRRLGQRQRYSCITGYKNKDDEDYATCTTGGWTPNPLCEEITCNKLDIPNAVIVSSEKWKYNNNEKVEYVCMDDYEGSFTITCRGANVWIGIESCREKTCSRPKDYDLLNNPRESDWTRRVGTTHRYSCKTGYKNKDDEDYATCTTDGWRPNPLCEKALEITCSRPHDYNLLDNPRESDWTRTVGTTQTYSCKTGYKNKDDEDYATCTDNGWTPNPLCEKALEITCSRPHDYNLLDNPRESDWTRTVGTTQTYSCKRGYKNKDGKDYATCTDNGWTPNPLCEDTCPKPQVANGFGVGPYHGTFFYSCDDNYKLLTKGWWSEAKCNDGVWPGPLRCIDKRKCGEIPKIPHAVITKRSADEYEDGEHIQIDCEAGYFSNISQMTCLNGKWDLNGTSLTMICRPLAKSCNPPPRVENAIVIGAFQKKYLSETEVTYQCRDKYAMEGGDTIRCKDGEWEQRKLTCIQDCEKPKYEEQTMTVTGEKLRYMNGDVIKYECNDPTVKSGGNATCVNGAWSEAIECNGYQLFTTMGLSLILLFLQLWGIVDVSLSENVCSMLPDVPHASVSEDSKQSEYQQGDVVYFTCETGYVSGPAIKYICTTEGWTAVRDGKCSLKPCELPDDTPNGQYQIIHGDDFVFGTIIKYICNEGYHMVSKADTRTCLLTKWSNHLPICEPLSCPPPPADGGITVRGLPDNDGPILADRFLRFSCDGPGEFLNGSSELICGTNGEWSSSFPSCEDITCQAEVMHPRLTVTGLPAANETMKQGHKLKFQCGLGYSLQGVTEVECLETGQWNAHFPNCSENCEVPRIPASVRLTTRVTSRAMRQGSKLRFFCPRGQFLQGSAEVECLTNGQWSDYIPTCGAPVGCGRPPLLEGGDTKYSVKYLYDHGERVEYACQSYYVLDGLSHKTCRNGEWTGEMRCLKPCTVREADMRKNNIAFRYTYQTKLYSEHNDEMSFRCIRGRHDGRLEMRQRCNDGEISLPSCQ
ncbi:complement factor H-like [Centroberyx affinis]|uniref:complement factor H-like n=1 Tax=Centroberyx affinis TaxID=166261 RepID=UPI003A5C5445